jgi:hypothetical protein
MPVPFADHRVANRGVSADVYMERCVRTWCDRCKWRALQRNTMAREFSWTASAQAYAVLYAALAAEATPPIRLQGCGGRSGGSPVTIRCSDAGANALS